jgi:cell division protein FtsQ
MKKRIIKISIWVIIAGYFLAALAFVSEKRSEVYCSSVQVTVNDSLKNKFVVQNDIVKMLSSKKSKVIGYPMNAVNTVLIENKIKEHPSIENAEAFKTVDGKLRIIVKQRDPILRIINNKNLSYYIDYHGTIMPLSGKYTSHVLIANGNIKEHFSIKKGTKVINNNQANSTNEMNQRMVESLFYLAKYIYEDEFWSAQIEQLYVNQDNDIELIPRVGSQLIIFGGIDDMDEKFKKLEILYNEGLKYEGWNNYEIINLKYKNQVVCKKRQNSKI